ncbi:hypothetical protein [Paenibacillus shenyangensis]|uniref:hypothetical protein n=1 Tax=Paenibacillus sp. A9 TaxID=1284352 RepID=UPI000360A495|nr:hypothetical protein [Paenibacillus sp. A9]
MITNTTTIRLEIEKGIRQKGHSLSSFGKLAGINRGIISGILNGNPPKSISIRQLDLMAEALGHPEGWMYEYYVDECFINEKADWRRIKAFLLRCTEIGRYDCIQAVLDRLMEDLSNTVSVFGLAEELYEEGKTQESLPFYECVIENEKHQHSERLAIAHYRVFRASISDDTEKSLRAVIRFEPYRNRLPENLILDALLQLVNVYYNFQDWNLLENCADELITLSTSIYNVEKEKMNNSKPYQSLDTKRELVVYYGQGRLIKAVALEHLGRYEEAKKFIMEYADLSWFEGLNETGKQEVEKFKLYAYANLHSINLLMGNIENLTEYVEFIEKNPKEILPSMLIITKAASQYNFNIDSIIEKFEDVIYQKKHLDKNLYPDVYTSRYMVLYYQLSIYFFKNKVYNSGADILLQSLALAVKAFNKNRILDCISLFENFKSYASMQQIEAYETILRGVNKNEKIFGSNGTTYVS